MSSVLCSFGDDLFPVPLVDIDGVQVVEILIAADRVHIGVDAMSRLDAVLTERHSLPFCKRLYDFHFQFVNILQSERLTLRSTPFRLSLRPVFGSTNSGADTRRRLRPYANSCWKKSLIFLIALWLSIKSIGLIRSFQVKSVVTLFCPPLIHLNYLSLIPFEYSHSRSSSACTVRIPWIALCSSGIRLFFLKSTIEKFQCRKRAAISVPSRRNQRIILVRAHRQCGAEKRISGP